MPSPNNKPQLFPETKRMRNQGIGMLILGVLAIVVCVIVLVLGVGNVMGQIRTTATIDSLDGNHITITYTDMDGNVYEHVPYTASGLWKKVGDKILIRYSVASPTTVHDVASFICLGVFTALISVLSIPFGAGMLKAGTAYQKRCQAALDSANTVTATICGVHPCGRYRVGKPSGWVTLDCMYIDDRKEKQFAVFTSDRFANPGHDLTGTVTVYVDPNDNNNYYVDLSTIDATPVPSQEDYV